MHTQHPTRPLPEGGAPLTRLSVKAQAHGIRFTQQGTRITLGEAQSVELVYDTSYYAGTEAALAHWLDTPRLSSHAALFAPAASRRRPWWKRW